MPPNSSTVPGELLESDDATPASASGCPCRALPRSPFTCPESGSSLPAAIVLLRWRPVLCRTPAEGVPVIPVTDYLHQVLALARPLPPRLVPITDALGCVLAEDLVGTFGLPGFDNSAMDGYAVRANEVAEASPQMPVSLPVVADIPAGDTRRHTMSVGQAMRIMTGAPIPQGADTIVPVELTDGGTTTVQIRASARPGQHVRTAGEDIAAGAVVLPAGTRIGPRQLALAASAGAGGAVVHPLPRVAVMSTGDELVQAGTVPDFGQVIDSNAPMLVAAIREAGFAAIPVTGVRDTPEQVLAALREVVDADAEPVDAVVTTGGVSMGAYDAVKEALLTLGTVTFTQVAMQPGKPQGVGVVGERQVPVFTLPGNPVSALVSFEVFVAPALRVMAGRPTFERPMQPAIAAHDFGSPPDKMQFNRVVVDRSSDGDGDGAIRSGVTGSASHDPRPPWRDVIRRPPSVRLAGVGQGSHMFGGLAEADALAVIPVAVTSVAAGDALTCLPLPGGWWG